MEQDLKRYDRPRYICSLFLPEGLRTRLHAILAWNLELAKIPEAITEPMIGHIRFTWWRETLDEIYAGKPPRKHPVAEALAPLIPTTPREYFDTIMDARQTALDELITDVETYAKATGGTLNLLCAEAMGITDEAVKQYAYEVGTDYALAGSSSRRKTGSSASRQAKQKESFLRRRHGLLDTGLHRYDGAAIFFRKQATIAKHWAKHPDDIMQSRLSLLLTLKLLF